MSRSDFELRFQKCPIVFSRGIASNLPDAVLPLIAITDAKDFPEGVLNGVKTTDGLALGSSNFDFWPMAGGTLIENQISTYPFANQTTAANNQQAQPLQISLGMTAPVNQSGGYNKKLALFTQLKKTLDLHQQQGGSFIVVTPSYIYQDCLLTSLRDLSNDIKRPQDMWQWTFMQPLLTLEAARAAQGNLNTKVTASAKITPDANGEISGTGLQSSIGANNSGASAATLPVAQPLTGTSVGGSSMGGGGLSR